MRRLCRWARGTGTLSGDVARDLRPVRAVRNRQPIGLTDPEVHALLRAAGASTHGFAARNYALAQVMLQAGLRVGEVAALRVADITLSDRSGNVRIRHGKGLKAREVPLNATARRALKRYLAARPASAKEAALFVSGRERPRRVHRVLGGVDALAKSDANRPRRVPGRGERRCPG